MTEAGAAAQLYTDDERRLGLWASVVADVRAGRLTPREGESQWRDAGIDLPFPATTLSILEGEWWRPSEAVAFIACRSRERAAAQATRLAFWGERLLDEEAEAGWPLSFDAAQKALIAALQRGALSARGLPSGLEFPETIPTLQWLKLEFHFHEESAVHYGFRTLVAPAWRELKLPASVIEGSWPSSARPPSDSDRQEDQHVFETGRPLEDALVKALLEEYGAHRPLLVTEQGMQAAAYKRLNRPQPSRSSTFRSALARAWPEDVCSRRRPTKSTRVQGSPGRKTT